MQGKPTRHRQHGEDPLNELIEMFEVGLVVFDPQLNIKYINQPAVLFLDLPPEWEKGAYTLRDIIERNLELGSYGDDARALETAKKLLDGDRVDPFDYVRESTTGRVLKVTGRPLEAGGMAITYTDISELHQAKQQLERQNEILHQEVEVNRRQLQEEKLAIERESEIRHIVLRNTHQGITLYDRDLKLVICNRRYRELLDLPDHLTETGSSLEDLVRHAARRGDYGPVDVEGCVSERLEVARRFEHRKRQRIMSDGRILEIVGTPVAMGFVTTYADVTETVKAQKAAQQAYEMLTEILEASPSGVGITRLRDGHIRWINTPGARLLGFENTEDALGYVSRNAWVNPDERALFLEEFQRNGFIRAKEIHARRITGEEFWCYLSWNRIDYKGDDCILFWMYDMTGQRDTLRKLIESEKLASLGGLVAGVAHEINTPIGVVVTGTTQLQELMDDCRRKFEGNSLSRSGLERYFSKSHDALNVILNNTQSAARLIQSFKQVSVDQASEEARQIMIAEYIDQVIQSLYPKAKRAGVTVSLESAPGQAFRTYPGALAQILTNLLQNAVVHGFGEESQAEIRIDANVSPERVLTLCFKDNGIGIPVDIQNRVFDPFFTTRRGSGGSGLGLNIVHNLVTHKLRGSIDLHSRVGEGSEFVMRIPELGAGSATA